MRLEQPYPRVQCGAPKKPGDGAVEARRPMAEALDPSYTLLGRNECLRKREMSVLIDCKSLYDHAHGLSAAGAGISDKLTSVDVTILREIRKETGLQVRWGPGSLQLADGLTKDKEEPALRLLGTASRASPSPRHLGKTSSSWPSG